MSSGITDSPSQTMKAAPIVKTPAQYIASLPEPRRSAIRTLHKTILAAVPALKPAVGYGMLGYGFRHYNCASGREGDWFVVGLASQKQHISLYLCVCDGDGYLAEKNKHRLGKVSTGRSCVRFRKLENLNLKVAMDLVKRAATLAARSKSS